MYKTFCFNWIIFYLFWKESFKMTPISLEKAMYPSIIFCALFSLKNLIEQHIFAWFLQLNLNQRMERGTKKNSMGFKSISFVFTTLQFYLFNYIFEYNNSFVIDIFKSKKKWKFDKLIWLFDVYAQIQRLHETNEIRGGKVLDGWCLLKIGLQKDMSIWRRRCFTRK